MSRELRLASRLREYGLTTVEVDGWRERGSSPVDFRGVIAHHTGGASTGELPSLRVLINGRSDLPGPLCNVGLARSGACYVVATGKANHGGSGAWRGVSGNSRFLGVEAENDGRQPWPQQQLDAYYVLCAALISLTPEQDAGMVCGHKEYATPRGRKPDPHSLDMDHFRTRVRLLMSPGARIDLEDEMQTLTPDRPYVTIPIVPGDREVVLATDLQESGARVRVAVGHVAGGWQGSVDPIQLKQAEPRTIPIPPTAKIVGLRLEAGHHATVRVVR